MFLTGYEHDNWIFTVFGMLDHEPPRELAGMLAFAGEYAPAHLLAAVQAGERIGPVVQHRMPSSQWRRYDKMRRFPDGLLVCALHGVGTEKRTGLTTDIRYGAAFRFAPDGRLVEIHEYATHQEALEAAGLRK